MLYRNIVLLCGGLLAGCDGRAKVSADDDLELERFKSATWLVADPIELYTPADVGVQSVGQVSLDPLNLLSYGRGCRETQRDLDEWGALSAAVVDAAGDAEATCDAFEALAAWQDEQANSYPTVRSRVQGGADTTAGVPTSGEAENAYATLVTVDNTDCPSADSWDEDACLSILSDCGEQHVYELQDAVLDVAHSAFTVRATLTGNLEEDGEDAGPFEATFTANICEIEAPELLVLY